MTKNQNVLSNYLTRPRETYSSFILDIINFTPTNKVNARITVIESYHIHPCGRPVKENEFHLSFLLRD